MSLQVNAPWCSRISLRPAVEGDFAFLYALHAATMKEYVDQTWGWDEAFQQSRYQESFVPGDTRIITWDGKEIGMLATEERDADVFLSLIEIDPGHQRQGIGALIISRVIEEAARIGKPVFLHVLKVNPAKRLYDRLGFSVVDETPTHFYMSTRLPGAGAPHV